MAKTGFAAHSGISERGIPPQLYQEHVRNMLSLASNWDNILPVSLKEVVRLSIMFHDLGKLSENCQKILRQKDPSEEKMENHVEAGISYCINRYKETKNEAWVYAAYFIQGHHIGFGDFPELIRQGFDPKSLNTFFEFNEDKFRDNREYNGQRFSKYIDESVLELVEISKRLMPDLDWEAKTDLDFSNLSSIDLRMALSVFSDADHLDTSHHYGLPKKRPQMLAFKSVHEKCIKHSERLEQKARSIGIPEETIQSRGVLFKSTCEVSVDDHSFFRCSAPTGKGKTLSLLNLASRIADKKGKSKIFNIIPFTNIISQTANEYREILEDKGAVNEIHSRVEYSSYLARKYSQLWDAPINISTSVQFFESLFSNKPNRMRKIKEFANSVIVFDEYHTSMPHYLWIPAIKAMKDMSEKYNVDFVFGSGSDADYWEIGMDDPVVDVKEVVSGDTYKRFLKEESERISFCSMGMFGDEQKLFEKIKSLVTRNGELLKDTLIITNTIANAVGLTREILKWDLGDAKVFHLTSFLTPNHKNKVLEEVKKRLRSKKKTFLIATSIVECGVDFSFEVGFREKSSLMSTIQTGGRVNRGGETECAKVYEFEFSNAFLRNRGNIFTKNFNLDEAIIARNGLRVSLDSSSEAVENEILNFGNKGLGDSIWANEKTFNFEKVKDQFKVIRNDSVQVIISKKIVDRMKKGHTVMPIEISSESVSVSKSRLEKRFKDHYEEIELPDGETINYWKGMYDEIYGIGCAM